MSADDAIFYREIAGRWYVMHGFASRSYADGDYLREGTGFDTRAEALEAAAGMADEIGFVEYGITRD